MAFFFLKSFLHISPDGLIEQLKAISRYSGDSSVRPDEPSTSSEPARALRDRPGGSRLNHGRPGSGNVGVDWLFRVLISGRCTFQFEKFEN